MTVVAFGFVLCATILTVFELRDTAGPEFNFPSKSTRTLPVGMGELWNGRQLNRMSIREIHEAASGTPRNQRHVIWWRYFGGEIRDSVGEFEPNAASGRLQSIASLAELLSPDADVARLGLFAAIVDLNPELAWRWQRDNLDQSGYQRGLFARSAWIVAREQHAGNLDQFLAEFGSEENDLRQAILARVRDWVRDPGDMRFLDQLCAPLEHRRAMELIGNSAMGYFRRGGSPAILPEIHVLFPENHELARGLFDRHAPSHAPQRLLGWYKNSGRDVPQEMLPRLAAGFARNSPPSGMVWISGIADERIQADTASHFIRSWLEQSSQSSLRAEAEVGAGAMMRAHGPGLLSDSIAAEVAQFFQMENDVDRARKWITLVGEQSGQQGAGGKRE
jgi:hypothetical protein